MRFTKMHGLGNDYVYVNCFKEKVEHPSEVARFVSDRHFGIGSDGLIMINPSKVADFEMEMYNADGSRGEMCGNGIRCVARLARERYPEATGERFAVTSGGREYRITCEEPIFGALPTFGAEIPLSLHGDDFPPSLPAEGFVGQPVPELDEGLAFTFLQPGNPHIVALVAPDSAWLFGSDGRLDTRRLAELGERANRMRGVFPRGINVSLFCRLDEGRIFAATYERGVGITSSCGTAMTSCATAAALLGLAGFDTTVEVWNRGGRVRCLPRRTQQGIVTRLTGDASFETAGRLRLDGKECIATGDASPLDPPCDRLRLTEETLRKLHEKYGLTIADDHD